MDQPQQPLDLESDQTLHHREVVMMLITDDMTSQLRRLVRQGRQRDHLALLQELGDWQFYGRDDVAPVLHAPYIGDP